MVWNSFDHSKIIGALEAFTNMKNGIKYSNKANATESPELPSSALFLGHR
jgi:hypothetical protein